MAVHLTDSAIAKASREAWASGKRGDLADAAHPGLRLRLTPPSRRSAEGSKTWMLCCRDREGRMRRFPLGAYPDIGISKARERAKALHVRVRQEGADPIAERRRERAAGAAAKAGVGTLNALLSVYTDQRGATLKSWTASRKRVELVFGALLTRPLGALKATDFQIVADSYPSSQSGAFAVRSLRPVLRWGARRGYAALELADLHQPATTVRRKRILSKDELAALLPVLIRSKRPYAQCMRFLLLTLARREEACAARWRDISLAGAKWIIRDTKNGEPHVVPLSRQAVSMLRLQTGRGIFGETIKPRPDDFVFRTKSGKRLRGWDREAKKVMADSDTSGWTRHDLRRTAATMLGELGETPDIIEAALNHVAIRSPLAANYNRSRYRPQVAAALQRLADALDGIEADHTGRNCAEGYRSLAVPT